jgi:hypothetical protein
MCGSSAALHLGDHVAEPVAIRRQIRICIGKEYVPRPRPRKACHQRPALPRVFLMHNDDARVRCGELIKDSGSPIGGPIVHDDDLIDIGVLQKSLDRVGYAQLLVESR